MKRLLVMILVIAVIGLTACASAPLKITTQTIPQAVPILYCPAPPTVARPVLPSDAITATTSDGDVAKDYAASVEALLGYSQQLEAIITQYNNVNAAYAALQAKVAADWKAKTGTDLVIDTPTTTITAPSK